MTKQIPKKPIEFPRAPRLRERGNAFLFILLGVILFGALAFVVARGMRSETTGNLTKRKAQLAALDTLNYAQKLGRAVNRLQRRNISENDISFDNASVAGYAHTPVQPDSNKIFHHSGGRVTWQEPFQDANDGSSWLFTGETCIVNIGTGGAGCDTNTVSDEELLAVLPNLDQGVCEEINDRLGITGIPANAGTGYSTTKFTGTYQDDTVPENMDGLTSGCFDGGAGQSGYHFYYVLIER